ncbi:unnamed protein product [Tilletia caries]|nr:unnamed protein product [Tilletia caries]
MRTSPLRPWAFSLRTLNVSLTRSANLASTFRRNRIRSASARTEALSSTVARTVVDSPLVTNAETTCTAPGELCGSAGKCISPGNNTLFPQEHCLKDAQCYSGKCVDDLPLTNKYDEHKELPIGSPQDPSRCDYLKPGQEGKCRSFVDCNGGICKNQACVLGTDGDACLYNQYCKNVCGLDGKCYSPPSNHSLGAGQPCTNSIQCATSDGCKAGSATRPVPGTSGTMRKVTETICTGSNPNGACVQDSDCAAGGCRNSTCKALPVGTSCSTDTQCTSATPDKYTASVCDGHGCLENRNCEAVLVGSSCRTSEDCDTSARCTSGKQCKLNNGEDCRSNSDCVSGACKDDVCMKSSTSTKTTATSSKSTTSTTTKKTTSPTTTSKTTATSKRTTSTMV